MDYLEIELQFKNGSKDWVSPIKNVETDVNIDEYNISIDNDIYKYKYAIKDIAKIDVLEIGVYDKEEISRKELYNFKQYKKCSGCNKEYLEENMIKCDECSDYYCEECAEYDEGIREGLCAWCRSWDDDIE